MARSRAALVLLVALALVACGEPTLESDDFAGSAQALRESVGPEERGRLDNALELVRRASTGGISGTEAFSVDGMTAADVLAEAQRIELRQERAWLEQEIGMRREVLEASERLAALEPLSLAVAGGNLVRVRVKNGLGVPLTSGWLRTTLSLPDGTVVTSEDPVGFGGALDPGEEREVRARVAGAVRDYLPPHPDARLEAAFTLAENDGTLILKEPDEHEAARAQAAIDAAERDLEELDRRLREIG